MSYLIAALGTLSTVAANLAGLESAIRSANSAAVSSTTLVASAAADDISLAIAALFSSHAQGYQALGAQAVAFHEQFVHPERGRKRICGGGGR